MTIINTILKSLQRPGTGLNRSQTRISLTANTIARVYICLRTQDLMWWSKKRLSRAMAWPTCKSLLVAQSISHLPSKTCWASQRTINWEQECSTVNSLLTRDSQVAVVSSVNTARSHHSLPSPRRTSLVVLLRRWEHPSDQASKSRLGSQEP